MLATPRSIAAYRDQSGCQRLVSHKDAEYKRLAPSVGNLLDFGQHRQVVHNHTFFSFCSKNESITIRVQGKIIVNSTECYGKRIGHHGSFKEEGRHNSIGNQNIVDH